MEKAVGTLGMVLVLLLAFPLPARTSSTDNALSTAYNAGTIEEFLTIRGVKNPGKPTVTGYRPASATNPLTRPDIPDQSKSSNTGSSEYDPYYKAGIGTMLASYSAVSVTFRANAIMNGNYPATQVRLTPHLLPDQAEGGDYLAWIVEDHGAQGLYLSTLQKNRPRPFSEEFPISRTKSYDVVIRINPGPQAPYQWEALWAESGQELTEFDRGTISRRSSKAQSLPGAVYTGGAKSPVTR